MEVGKIRKNNREVGKVEETIRVVVGELSDNEGK